jgi:pimeloyl-ACP methyl ester carboxylesterase
VKRAVPVLAAAAVLASARRPRADPGTALPTVTGRPVTVTADDGVPLSAEIHGSVDAEATVVLAHGYELSQRLWARQVQALLTARPDLRIVTYDHRGHGRSGRTAAHAATLAQLARDLLAVLDAVAPTGPVLLAGHSMGGMTLTALAEERPEVFGPRVLAAAFVASSSGRLEDVTYGLPAPIAKLSQRLLPVFNERARRLEESGRGKPARPGIARLLFGRGATMADIHATLSVMAACPAGTVADFHHTFVEHNRVEALAALSSVPVLVLCGTKDRICPLAHSQAIAGALSHARLVVYPGAGHMLQLERADEVSRQLVGLADLLPRPEGRRRTRSSSEAS